MGVAHLAWRRRRNVRRVCCLPARSALEISSSRSAALTSRFGFLATIVLALLLWRQRGAAACDCGRNAAARLSSRNISMLSLLAPHFLLASHGLTTRGVFSAARGGGC